MRNNRNLVFGLLFMLVGLVSTQGLAGPFGHSNLSELAIKVARDTRMGYTLASRKVFRPNIREREALHDLKQLMDSAQRFCDLVLQGYGGISGTRPAFRELNRSFLRAEESFSDLDPGPVLRGVGKKTQATMGEIRIFYRGQAGNVGYGWNGEVVEELTDDLEEVIDDLVDRAEAKLSSHIPRQRRLLQLIEDLKAAADDLEDAVDRNRHSPQGSRFAFERTYEVFDEVADLARTMPLGFQFPARLSEIDELLDKLIDFYGPETGSGRSKPRIRLRLRRLG